MMNYHENRLCSLTIILFLLHTSQNLKNQIMTTNLWVEQVSITSFFMSLTRDINFIYNVYLETKGYLSFPAPYFAQDYSILDPR